MTNKKTLFTFAGIYLFLYIFNFFHPMNFGDDYVYSFIWHGHSMMEPLSEEAVRVSSFKDLLISQWSHYFTWGGRTIGHLFAQFFLWMGKETFNLFNALIGTLLVAEIYWCIHKGTVGFRCNSCELCGILFLLWAFTPAFSSVFLWMTASCVYLWTHTILLGFVIPYVQKYYCPQKARNTTLFFKTGIFFGGIIAGWTNENSVCWILLLLLIFSLVTWNNNEFESWMGFGVLGLFIGYAFLMLAPGNVVRLKTTNGMDWIDLNIFKHTFRMLIVVLTYQLFLWYFNLKSVYKLKKLGCMFPKEYLFVKILCATAFGSVVIMLFSPFFPARSGFFGTILLIIATGVLFNIQKEHNIKIIQSGAKTFLIYVGTAYFIMTVTVSLFNFNSIKLQMQEIIASAQQIRIENRDVILTVDTVKGTSKLQDLLSGFHVPDYKLSKDENDWKNVAFSRYYKIKGIRMLKEKDEK